MEFCPIPLLKITSSSGLPSSGGAFGLFYAHLLTCWLFALLRFLHVRIIISHWSCSYTWWGSVGDRTTGHFGSSSRQRSVTSALMSCVEGDCS